MSKRANYVLIGTFVVASLLLLALATVLFSSGSLWAKKIRFYAFFDTSLNGLDIGAPVKFKGVRVGSVESIEIIYDDEIDEAITAVVFGIDANMFKAIRGGRLQVSDYRMFYTEQISRGLAAKLSMESILTGRLYVGLDYYKVDQERFSRDINLRGYQQMPSVATELDEFMASFDSIMKKLSKFEFEKISARLIAMLDAVKDKVRDLNFKSVNKAMEAIADMLAFDSGTRRSLDISLQQFSKALHALRILAEYIERNPNALVAGRAL
ncbi:MAG: MlaD family protein [Puniceicoccales bacterium]|jgi:paraquat-inducible protein B|nr:MlaD family protein [Puniceicoccales bacterium]